MQQTATTPAVATSAVSTACSTGYCSQQPARQDDTGLCGNIHSPRNLPVEEVPYRHLNKVATGRNPPCQLKLMQDCSQHRLQSFQQL